MSDRHDGWGKLGPWPGPLDRPISNDSREGRYAPAHFPSEIAIQGEPPEEEEQDPADFIDEFD